MNPILILMLCLNIAYTDFQPCRAVLPSKLRKHCPNASQMASESQCSVRFDLCPPLAGYLHICWPCWQIQIIPSERKSRKKTKKKRKKKIEMGKRTIMDVHFFSNHVGSICNAMDIPHLVTTGPPDRWTGGKVGS